MTGRLIGIARHARPKAAMEVIDQGVITPGEGLRGDFRGSLKSGRNKREVTVMAREAWDAAVNELGRDDLDWWDRRANLLVEGVTLPRETGARLHLSGGVVLEVTAETKPCERMDDLAPGLQACLRPNWRGGVSTRVIAGGPVAIGDEVECDA